MSRVVIHQAEDGGITAYADGGVTVFWVDERTPEDRIYRMTPDAIPDGMLDGEVGHAGDQSAASIKGERLRRLLDGEPPFDVV